MTTSPSSAVEDDRIEASSPEASRVVPYRSILKSRAEEEVLSSWSQSTLSSKLEIKSSLRKGGCGGEPQHLPTLTGSGEKDLHLLRQDKVRCTTVGREVVGVNGLAHAQKQACLVCYKESRKRKLGMGIISQIYEVLIWRDGEGSAEYQSPHV